VAATDSAECRLKVFGKGAVESILI